MIAEIQNLKGIRSIERFSFLGIYAPLNKPRKINDLRGFYIAVESSNQIIYISG